jgi:hypothetical protein
MANDPGFGPLFASPALIAPEKAIAARRFSPINAPVP